MADEFSFDVVSKVDLQAIDDIVNTANKEISVRFDFRGSVSRLEFNKEKGEITVYSDNEGKLPSVTAILQSRSAKRGIDLKAFEYGKVETALGGKAKQAVKIVQGLSKEKAKEIVAGVKNAKIKVTPSIQGETVRVTAKSKDALQETMAIIKGIDVGIPLQFTNFR